MDTTTRATARATILQIPSTIIRYYGEKEVDPVFASVLAISMRHESCRETVVIYCFTPGVLIRMATRLVL